MAEPITLNKLADASIDADTLGEFANEDKTVTSRLGLEYPSAPMVSRIAIENGLLGATAYSTYASLVASAAVSGDYGIVTSDTDTSKNGVYIKSGSSWVLSKYNPLKTIVVKGVNLNDIMSNGVYHCYSSTYATSENNYPFTGSGAVTIVSVESNIVRQQNLSQKGTAQRYGVISGGVATWQPWTGIAYSFNEILDISVIKNHLTKGKPNTIIVSDIAQIGGHLDNATAEGDYFIEHSGIGNKTNGFPVTGSGGFLQVRDNGKNAIHQSWKNHNGYANRWGSKSADVVAWQPWRGVSQYQNGILDLSNSAASQKRNIIVYGSSTMWYLSDEFAAMADRHNLTLKNHGVSGDVLGGAGLAQGSNVVTVTFTGGSIPANTNTPVLVNNSFGDALTKDVSVELSNGVKGTLYANGTFTATNLTASIAVPSVEAYRVFEPEWYRLNDGVYVFNIGKNNVTRIDAQEIINKQIEMIDYIPNTADFIVGGHFTNTGSASTRDQIEQINDTYRQKYGLKYFDVNELLFDDATWTRLGLTKTAADITAINNRQLPPSLSRNSSHLSEAMDQVLADAIEDKLIALGYIT